MISRRAIHDSSGLNERIMRILGNEKRAAVIAALMTAILLGSTVFSTARYLGWGVAGAHERKTRTVAGINYSQKRFFGRVNSRRPRCERRRRVALIKERKGISDRVVATTRSNRRGRWSIRVKRRPRGRFYVVVARRARTTGYAPGPHLHVCRRDRSGKLRLRRR
jgi:hypothetical protein